MEVLDLLERNIQGISSKAEMSEDLAYGEYRYCFGMLETLLMLGEIDSDTMQTYSKMIRDQFDALGYCSTRYKF